MVKLKFFEFQTMHRWVFGLALALGTLAGLAHPAMASSHRDKGKYAGYYIDDYSVVGAVKDNMKQIDIGIANYGTALKPGDHVIIRVTTKPHDIKGAWDKIDWHGVGQSWPGSDNNYRMISKSEAAYFQVRPTLNGDGPRGKDKIDLWVIQGKIENMVGYNQSNPSDNAYRYGTNFYPTGEKLGARWYHPSYVTSSTTGNARWGAVGKVVSRGTFLPGASAMSHQRGAVDVIDWHGLMFRRQQNSVEFRNNERVGGDPDWHYDDAYHPGGSYEDGLADGTQGNNAAIEIVPTGNGNIYFTDGPDVFPGNDTVVTDERHMNMAMSILFNREFITNPEYSDSDRWFYEGAWKLTGSPAIPFNHLLGSTPYIPLGTSAGAQVH